MAQLRIHHWKESQISRARWRVAVKHRIVINRYADGYDQGAMFAEGIVG
jgi:hypothetical protein